LRLARVRLEHVAPALEQLAPLFANAGCLLICLSYVQNAPTFLELILLVFLRSMARPPFKKNNRRKLRRNLRRRFRYRTTYPSLTCAMLALRKTTRFSTNASSCTRPHRHGHACAIIIIIEAEPHPMTGYCEKPIVILRHGNQKATERHYISASKTYRW
jgi:hypothetical protein